MSTRGTRIVTPEAVELDLDTAGLASRLLAALIDVMAVSIVLQALFMATSVGGLVLSLGGGDVAGIVLTVLLVVGFFGVLVVWPVAWEVATRGRSIGKMAMGLRVVTVEGAPIRFRHALVRGLVGVVELVMTFGVVAVAVALASRRFRRLGDHLAGTVVVRERGAGASRAHPHRFVPYPGWEHWAHHLDATRLTTDDYRLVRTFLIRSPGLPPEARTRLGGQILDRVLPRTGCDAGTRASLRDHPAEAPLVAVAAAYQRRFDGIGAR